MAKRNLKNLKAQVELETNLPSDFFPLFSGCSGASLALPAPIKNFPHVAHERTVLGQFLM